MLALMNVAESTELFLPSGKCITLPPEVMERVVRPHEFMTALRVAFDAGLISHADYLAGRDVLADRAPISLDVQQL